MVDLHSELIFSSLVWASLANCWQASNLASVLTLSSSHTNFFLSSSRCSIFFSTLLILSEIVNYAYLRFMGQTIPWDINKSLIFLSLLVTCLANPDFIIVKSILTCFTSSFISVTAADPTAPSWEYLTFEISPLAV